MASPYIVKKLLGLLGDSELVNMYLNKYGEIVSEQYVEQMKKYAEFMMNSTGKKDEKNPEGEDPIFEMLYQCPACYRENVVGYHLRAKSQQVKETLFLVPQYLGLAKYFAVDFNLLQTIVCPDCLFASPDPKDWATVSKFTGKVSTSQLSVHTKLMSDIRDQEFKRKTTFPTAKTNIDYFNRPRDYTKAIESIKLSIMRAELEEKSQIPATNFKLGSYYLKIADIEKKMKKEYVETLKTAEKFFSAATLKSDCPTVSLEMMCIYQVIALNLSIMKSKEKAAEFLKIIKNTLLEKENEVKNNPSPEARTILSEVKKWESRIGLLWEYRDDTDFWKDV